MSAARGVGRRLAELGHRRIAVIGSPPLVTTSRDWLDGFRSGLRDHGILLAPQQIAAGARRTS